MENLKINPNDGKLKLRPNFAESHNRVILKLMMLTPEKLNTSKSTVSFK